MPTDFKKTLDSYKARNHVIDLLEVPARQYLMIDGHGDPGTSKEFADAITALYPTAYTLKFAIKALGHDYVVPPLEGLWWSDDPTVFTSARDKSQWNWTLMIMTPEWASAELFGRAVATAAAKKDASAHLDRVRLETLDEGLCAQTLHVGSFEGEGEILAQMHDEFIPSQGLVMTGKHHEIYFSDFRKVAPEKLRTILRQPVSRG